MLRKMSPLLAHPHPTMYTNAMIKCFPSFLPLIVAVGRPIRRAKLQNERLETSSAIPTRQTVGLDHQKGCARFEHIRGHARTPRVVCTMVRLTEKLVLEKTKCTSLFGVRNINLWGSSLDDVEVVQRMPNLESLSLSVNRLASLRVFARCPNLVDLHLRKNDIADLDEVRFLVGLDRLRTLWLCDNPCALEPNYRMRVIAMLPSLLVLDGDEVTLDERRAAETMPDVFLPSPGASRSSPEPSPGSTRGDHDDARSERTVNADRAVRDANARSYELAASRQLAGLGPIGGHHVPSQRADMPLGNLGGAGGGARSEAAMSLAAEMDSSRHSPKGPSPGRGVGAPAGRNSNNVLYAVVALLGELDGEGLRIVRGECDERLRGARY